MHKIEGAHLQCVNSHYAKFDYKKIKTVAVTDYTNETPPKHFGWIKCRSTPLKTDFFLSNVHKTGGAHLQCVNKHYAKFEYKGIKTVGATEYINQTHPKHFQWKKCLDIGSTSLKKGRIIYQMCTK